MVKLAHTFGIAMLLIGAAYARYPCEPLQDTYKNASGRLFCARHHIPLITARGFSMSDRDRTTIIDPAEEEEEVQLCNPNFINDYFSLRRTRLISKPYRITCCKKCEAAVHAWRLRHYPGYRSYDSGGSYLKQM